MTSIEIFNTLPLKSQQSTIAEIINRDPNCNSINVLTDINNFLLFLLKFNENPVKHYFSIFVEGNPETIEEGCEDLIYVRLSHNTVDMLSKKILSIHPK